MLLDLGHLLNIQLAGVAGTYVARNPLVCFTADVAWSRRNDSYFSFELSSVCCLCIRLHKQPMSFSIQCPSMSCTLFAVETMCVSSCSTCGTLCDAFPISDLSSLELYKTQGCTVVSGDLYIMGLPSSISKGTLLANLQAITAINGVLHFQDNLFLTSLLFFKNLVSLEGGYYNNNPQLVDARLPSLQTLSGDVEVYGSPRLCPARQTKVGYGGDDSGCTNLDEVFFYDVQGSITIADLPLFANVITRVMSSISNGQV